MDVKVTEGKEQKCKMVYKDVCTDSKVQDCKTDYKQEVSYKKEKKWATPERKLSWVEIEDTTQKGGSHGQKKQNGDPQKARDSGVQLTEMVHPMRRKVR